MRQLITERIKRLARPQAPRYERGARSARVIAVSTIKGGVGKTTTAVHLAAGLSARQGRRVLLLDLDAQGHSAASLGIGPCAPGAPSLSGVLLGEGAEVLDAVRPSGRGGLDVTAPDAQLASAEGALSGRIGREMVLGDALEITRTHYDVIVIDCPPNLGNLTMNALVAADYALVPTDLSPLGVSGADELLGALATLERRLGRAAALLGIVLTRVDGRNTSINDAVRAEIAEAWGGALLETEIGVSTQICASQSAGRTAFEHAPRSRGAAHYAALCDEIALRLFGPGGGVH